MAESNTTAESLTKLIKKSSSSTFARIFRYTISRLTTLFLTVVVGVYLTIMIANMGGYVDTIMRAEIRERITQGVLVNKAYQDMAPETRKKIAEDLIAVEEKRLNLDTPVVIRSFNYLKNALKLELGRAQNMTSDNGSRTVRLILLERLPATMLLMGTSQLFLFFSSIYFALSLSRNYGSWLDRLVISLSPTSAAPSWFYGIFLILIFSAVLKVLPFGGMVDAPPPETTLGYSLSVLKHLILPGASLVVSAFFLSIYNWRTFFLIYSSEDYVEMAKAKGLPARDIERQYILRPTLPNIITNFALLLIGLWTGAIVTETIFLWPGLGITLYRAVGLFDIPVIVGSTIIFAYLLAITVFLLDFVYALVDPRVKVGG
ncbi:MAG: ABC transporter permease [Anaerolineales bacterium]|nr:ABC transporter permease [Anaerolineales bacterium]MBP6209476.1 ABC transporter permease [Anaerolineales bacterium]MBP8164082.1 ABC transporter permease [Anaerolineales bacterium]